MVETGLKGGAPWASSSKNGLNGCENTEQEQVND